MESCRQMGKIIKSKSDGAYILTLETARNVQDMIELRLRRHYSENDYLPAIVLTSRDFEFAKVKKKN